MAFVIFKLPNEPIILLQVDLPLEQHLNTLHHVAARCADLAVQHDGLLYRVVDAQQVDVAYSDILLLLDDLKNDYPGSLLDPQIHTLAVGNSPMLTLAARKLQRQFDFSLPIFPTLEAALHAARSQIAARAG